MAVVYVPGHYVSLGDNYIQLQNVYIYWQFGNATAIQFGNDLAGCQLLQLRDREIEING